MKKIVSLLLAMILLLPLLASCAPAGPTTGTEPSDYRTRAVLRVSTSPDFAPMVFVDPGKRGQDQFVGFDMTLARFIADELNMDLEILPMAFNACQQAVIDGTVDLSLAGYVWSSAREKDFNLSDTYLAGNSSNHQVLLTLEKNAGRYAEPGDFEGAVVGAQNTSLQQLLVNEQLPKARLELFSSLDTAVQNLLSGQIDCLAVSAGNADSMLSAYPNLGVTQFSFWLDERYMGNVILLQKGNDALTAQINAALKKASAYYDAWYQQAKTTPGIQIVYDEKGNAVGKIG